MSRRERASRRTSRKLQAQNVQLRVRKALKAHYDPIWQKGLSEARSVLKRVIGESFRERVVETKFGPGFTEEYYHRYYVTFLFDDGGKLYRERVTRPWFKELQTAHTFGPGFRWYSFGMSGSASDVSFEFEPVDFSSVLEQIINQLNQQISKEKIYQEQLQKKKEDQLLRLPKSKALENAKRDVLDVGVIVGSDGRLQGEADARKVIETVALRWGLNPKEVEEAVLKDPSVVNEVRKRDIIVHTTLSRLPRFIYRVVAKVPVTFRPKGDRSRSSTAAYWKRSLGKILVYWGRWGGDLNSYLGNLAHEYWHAFEDLSGFKRRSQEQFEKIVQEARQGRGAFEDFERVVQIVDEFGGEHLSGMLKDFERRWGKKYFETRDYDLLDKVAKDLKNPALYSEMSEILAETLAAIVTQDLSTAVSLSLMTWMNQKFSAKERTKNRQERISRRQGAEYE